MTGMTKSALAFAIFGTVLLAGCDLEHHSNVVVAGNTYEILQADEFFVDDGGPPEVPDLYIDPGKGYNLLRCSSNTTSGCIRTLEYALSHTPPKQAPADEKNTMDDERGGAGQ